MLRSVGCYIDTIGWDVDTVRSVGLDIDNIRRLTAA